MSESLPVVQKAQPFWVCLTCGTQEEEPAENCKQNSIRVAHYSVIEEERAGYEKKIEGYEKREQTLKNKIKELAVEFESWRTTNDSNLGFSFGVFLKQHSEELLGLSKQ